MWLQLKLLLVPNTTILIPLNITVFQVILQLPKMFLAIQKVCLPTIHIIISILHQRIQVILLPMEIMYQLIARTIILVRPDLKAEYPKKVQVPFRNTATKGTDHQSPVILIEIQTENLIEVPPLESTHQLPHLTDIGKGRALPEDPTPGHHRDIATAEMTETAGNQKNRKRNVIAS